MQFNVCYNPHTLVVLQGTCVKPLKLLSCLYVSLFTQENKYCHLPDTNHTRSINKAFSRCPLLCMKRYSEPSILTVKIE